jgi:hypothetical protein
MTTMDKVFWNKEEILRTFLLHGSVVRCNNIESLIQFALNDPIITQWFNHQPPDRYWERFQYLPEYVREHSSATEISSRRDALRLLFAHEVSMDNEFRVSRLDHLMGEVQSLEAAVERAYSLSVGWYSRVGLELSCEFPVRVVDDYPHPYERLTGAAMVPDVTDMMRYGIPRGIYFRRDRMSVIPSSLTVAHELVHAFISERDEGLLARGLEEGMSDFFSFVLVGGDLFDERVLDNLFISKRLKYSGHKQKFQLYMDYFRQSTWLYGQFGLSCFLDLLRKGRPRIKEVEVLLASGRLDELKLPRSEPNSHLKARAERLALLYPEHEVVSPEAFYLVLRSQLRDMPLQSALHTKALDELQQSIFGVFLNAQGAIEYDDFPTLMANPSFRYCADPGSIDAN